MEIRQTIRYFERLNYIEAIQMLKTELPLA